MRAIADALEAGLVIQTGDGTIVEVNDAAGRILRMPPGQMVGRSPRDPDWPEVQVQTSRPAGPGAPDARVRTSGPFGGRLAFPRADATVLWVDVATVPVGEADGTCYVASILVDVTSAVEADDRLAAVERIAHVATWSWRVEGRQLEWSPELNRMFGFPEDRAAGALPSLDRFLDPDDAGRAHRDVSRAVMAQEPFEVEMRIMRADGTHQVVVSRGEPVLVDGRLVRYSGTMADVTDEREREARLRDREEHLRVLIDTSPDIIVRLDRDLRHVHINQAGADLARRPADEIVGGGLDVLGAPQWLTQLWERELRAVLESGRSATFDWTLKLPGDERSLESHAAPEFGHDGAVTHIVVVSRDVTERRRAAEALAYQATHDGLTGLPNRRVLHDVLEAATRDAVRGEERFAVLLLDVDRFKLLNDTLGHPTGDAVLVAVTERLRAAVREGDFISRLGGDEFVIVATGVEDDDDARRAAERVLTALRHPVVVDGQEFRPSVSIGIARPDAEASSATELLRRADAAMYLAKERGRDRLAFFDRELQQRVAERVAIDGALRRGLDHELRIHYQPEVDLRTGEIVALEALARWERPDEPMVPASEFVPVAEESELILDLGRRVLAQVAEDVAAWYRAAGGAPLPVVHVNLSARELADPTLVARVRTVLDDAGVPHGTLWFELTETTLMSDTPTVHTNLLGLTALEVPIVIDDFGSGYSSLAYLKRLPVAAIKIDRSFVELLPSSTEDAAIVEAVVSLGRALGVAVIAEGVETEEQRDALLGLGCARAQGFLYSRAVPPGDVEELLRASV